MGHVVSEEGIRTGPGKLEAVQKWRVSKKCEGSKILLKLHSLLQEVHVGLCKIARLLNDLLVGHCMSKKNKERSKPAHFVWTERQQTSFDTLKEN